MWSLVVREERECERERERSALRNMTPPPSATLSTTYPTWIDLRTKLFLVPY